MIVAGSASPLLLSSAGGYNLTNSLRFRASASAYLSRTPATSTNRKTWTWSGWVKRGGLGSVVRLFSADNGAQQTLLRFQADNTLQFQIFNSGVAGQIITSQVFRDPSAWYHIIAVMDTAQVTSSNRMKLYLNGTQITALSTASYPSQNYDAFVNQNILHSTSSAGTSEYMDGYLTEVNFIDGQALTPSSFGATSATTGVWQPIRYAGTYGTNGFYLPFTDNSALTTSSNVGLGRDYSGNGNYWTTNNISITAGATYDSMTDVPTLTSATEANYCVWNPVGIYVGTPTDGNLKISGTSAGANGTMGASSGKFYWETVYTAIGSAEGVLVGIRSTDSIATGAAEYVGYYGGGSENGKKTVNGVVSAYAATWTTGDIMGVALDLDGGTVTFYKNNVSQGAISFTVGGKTWTSFNWRTGAAGTNTATINFGQRPFSYTPPTGFLTLNTFNLPTPTIGATASTLANKNMDATLYTGTGATQSIVNSGGMQPDLIWFKARATTFTHSLFDSVRGRAFGFSSAEALAEQSSSAGNDLASFDSNGFTVGAPQNWNSPNNASSSPVAWQWKAGGSAVTNTAGSITSQVSANTSAGFSVVTYTGTGANATVGHGLGVALKMMLVKSRTAANDWNVYHSVLGGTKRLFLNTTAGEATSALPWNNTAPTSTNFSVGTSVDTNANGDNYVAYCFAQIAGYSAFGSYTGNGSADGTFVYLGFRPAFFMVKRTNTTGAWLMLDDQRIGYNPDQNHLQANASDPEYTDIDSDFLSNGFKARGTASDLNASGSTYIYMAFAENPFKYANAR